MHSPSTEAPVSSRRAAAREGADFEAQLTEMLRSSTSSPPDLAARVVEFLAKRGYSPRDGLTPVLAARFGHLASQQTITRLPEHVARLVTNILQQYRAVQSSPGIPAPREALVREFDIGDIVEQCLLEMPPDQVIAAPEQYVIEVNDQIVFQSSDQVEALARYAEEMQRNPGVPVRFAAPGAQGSGATVRGRALARLPEVER